jgi:hypothetical protein
MNYVMKMLYRLRPRLGDLWHCPAAEDIFTNASLSTGASTCKSARRICRTNQAISWQTRFPVLLISLTWICWVCVVQIKQAQVKEVLKYNVRAVSRLFSSHKAYGHMAAGHDSLTMHSMVAWARTGHDESILLLGWPRLTPAAG